VRTLKTKRSAGMDFRGGGGFTLLEVLVSLAVLGIALTVVLQIFSANLRNIASAEDHVYASAKAAARMRELLDSDTLSETTWTETTRDGYSMDVSVSELLKDRTSNLPMKLLQVDLTIHWLKGKRDKSLTLRTIKTIDRS
jgi:prepilin-type N-terminal cleavage/methylation domain-containing protein